VVWAGRKVHIMASMTRQQLPERGRDSTVSRGSESVAVARGVGTRRRARCCGHPLGCDTTPRAQRASNSTETRVEGTRVAFSRET